MKGGEAMRTNLYMFRHSMKLSQAAMAKKIGCTRSTYSSIEIGARDGRQAFWNDLQKAFNVPENRMWELMKCDKK